MKIPGFYVKRPIEEICSRLCLLSPSFLLFSFFVFLFFFFISILFPLVITQVFSIEFRRMHETTTPYRYAIKPGFNSIPRRRGRRYFHPGGGRKLILLSVLITPRIRSPTKIVKLAIVSGILDSIYFASI